MSNPNNKNNIPPAYVASEYEDAIYKLWEKSGAFSPEYNEGPPPAKGEVPRLSSGRRGSLPKESKFPPFVISMPPPNATGQLHLGHAVMLALEDIMCRFARMKGHPTLWLPGTDHAGIATQNRVEKDLAKEGKSRHDFSRKEFLKKVSDFVEGSKNTIRSQVRKMGSSCDWSREEYTMSARLSKTVNAAFKKMFDDGLIYRGDRIVNWCTRCQSTLSDDEVTYKEQVTKFYYFQYGPFEIGTARPETKYGDHVVVVHPDDERYKKYHGQKLSINWIGKDPITATVVADPLSDMSMGSGVMTATPAHSFVDFDLAQKYGFEITQMINTDGKLTSANGPFEGLSTEEARSTFVEILQKKGLVNRIDENYINNLSVCYRCSTPIQPLVSKQWFIDVNHPVQSWNHSGLQLEAGRAYSLKEVMQHVVRSNQIEIIPDKFNKTYFQWIDNLRDWCISRQIWWGHRVPVWYKKEGEGKKAMRLAPQRAERPNVSASAAAEAYPERATASGGSSESRDQSGIRPDTFVGEEPPGSNYTRDPDTLDTWFSSGLWTFSTLGWSADGNHHEDFTKYHPTSVMETGYDIMFFWVARMILQTTYLTGQVPFKKVYLHGLIRTRNGAKMSKSHPETCIDPLDIIPKYGADALRLSLFVGSTAGNDSRLYDEKIAGYRNFVNKLWNVSRYILMSSKEESQKAASPERGGASDGFVSDLSEAKGAYPERGAERRVEGPAGSTSQTFHPQPTTLADKWIVTRLNDLVMSTTQNLESMNFSQAAEELYHFTWNELADWYVEITKVEGDSKKDARPERGGPSDSFVSASPAGGGTHPEQATASGGSSAAKDQSGTSDKSRLLLYILRRLLILWHPFTPYVTEEIWSHLTCHCERQSVIARSDEGATKQSPEQQSVIATPQQRGKQSPEQTCPICKRETQLLISTPWPSANMDLMNPQAVRDFTLVQTIITEIRALRQDHKVPPSKKISAVIISKTQAQLVEQNANIIQFLARIETLQVNGKKPKDVVSKFIGDLEIHIPMSTLTDPAKETSKLEKEIEKLSSYAETLKKKLANKQYVKNAPKEVVEKDRAVLKETKSTLAKSQKRLKSLAPAPKKKPISKANLDDAYLYTDGG